MIFLIEEYKKYYNTLKYLKFRQLFFRLYYLFPKLIKEEKKIKFKIVLFEDFFFINKNLSTVNFKDFNFINYLENITKIGWNSKLVSKLWTYNLHYFDYLNQSNSSLFLDCQIHLIQDWVTKNSFGYGVGWEPYPTSLRIINWIKWHWKSNKLTNEAKISLWNQVRWLEHSLEYHLLGNHIFVNAKALLFACAFFNLNSKSSYYKKAISILNIELQEQFLEDGAHFELSPMYHSLAMEDLLDLINISNKLPKSFPFNEILKRFYKGMIWLETMIYKNNELSHFNDCANGIAPTYSELESYAIKLGLNNIQSIKKGINYHKESGFVVYIDEKSHLIADFGKIGPDYLPGHAHADTLSFELAVKGERIVVNSGTSIYGNSVDRLFQRGTAAHSTIEIDMENSSEVWSGFRVGRRAFPFNIQINSNFESNDRISFQASHKGYSKLKNKPIHTRKFNFSNNIWSIEDEISGYGNQVDSRFYLHPEIEIRKKETGLILSKKSIDLINFKFDLNLDLKIIDSFYHDQFGVNKANKCIKLSGISPCKMVVKLEIL